MKKSPIKLYRGKKRVAFSHYRGGYKRWLLWALALKPGDYFASCSGCNRRVARIEPYWRNAGDWFWNRPRETKTWFIYDVRITDTRGYEHGHGGGCALPAESREEQIAWWRTLPESNFKEVVLSERVVVDEHDEFLPEFEAEMKHMRD